VGETDGLGTFQGSFPGFVSGVVVGDVSGFVGAGIVVGSGLLKFIFMI